MADRARRIASPHRCTALAISLIVAGTLACGGDDGGDDDAPKISGAVEFVDQPGTQVAFAPIQRPSATEGIRVKIVDDDGNDIPDATDAVTITLEANPGVLLLHASGIDDPNTVDNEGRLIELVEVEQLESVGSALQPGDVRYVLEKNWRLNAPTSFAYDAENDRYLLANRATDNLYRGDPRTGEATLIGNGTAETLAGMAFEVGGDGRLFAVRNKNFGGPTDRLYLVDQSSWTTSDLGALTPVPADRNLLYFSGLATLVDPLDPTTGTLYATAAMSADPAQPGQPTGHVLVEIDPEALTATVIGNTGKKIAGLAAHPDGTLYGILGAKPADPMDPTPEPEALKVVSTSDGSLSNPLAAPSPFQLTNGADGEAIVFVAAGLYSTVADPDRGVMAQYGPVTVDAVAGVATFDALDAPRIDATGAGYTLRASAPGRASATSGSFAVTAPTLAESVQFVVPTNTTVPESQVAPPADNVVEVNVVLSDALPHDVFVTAAVGGTASDVNDDEPDTDLDSLDYVRFFIPAGETVPATPFRFTIIDDDEDEGVEIAPGVFQYETVEFRIVDASLALDYGPIRNLTFTIDDSGDAPAP